MNLKINLGCVLILLCLEMFSIQVVNARKLAFVKSTSNLFSRATVSNMYVLYNEQYNFCLGQTAHFANYRSSFETIKGTLALSDVRIRYYLPDFEFNSFNKDCKNHFESKEYLLHRSKNQNIAGWILLTGGTAMAIIGATGFDGHFDNRDGNNSSATRSNIFGFVMLAGIAADLVSIPLFIRASHNKKLATFFSVGSQSIYNPRTNSFCLSALPAFTLRIAI